jgi:RNA polymerase sigma-70 factor, ECF subfamily
VRREETVSEDADLLSRSAAGDRDAFDAFVLRHREAVWRFVQSLTWESATAEDALQEVFLSAWRGAVSFRGEGSARAWLLAIARNAVFREKRRRAGEPSSLISLTELGEAAGWGSEFLADPQDDLVRRDEVRRAFSLLAPEERELLLLRDVEGLSNEECSQMLELSLAAIKSRLHRARLRFMAHVRGGQYGQ